MYTYWIALIEIKTLNTPIYKYMSYADTHPSNMVQHMILQGSRVDSMPKKKPKQNKNTVKSLIFESRKIQKKLCDIYRL